MPPAVRSLAATLLAAFVVAAVTAATAALAQPGVSPPPRAATTIAPPKAKTPKPRRGATPPAAARADTSLLEQYALTNRFRLGRPGSFAIPPAGEAVLFLRSGPRSFVQDLWAFDPATGKEKVLLTAEQILRGADEQLSAEERARRERQRQSLRGIVSYQLSDDGRRILVPLSGHLYVVDRASNAVRTLPDAAGAPIDARFSPDGKKVACVREGDLWVTDVDADNGWRLTNGASDTLTHGVAEFVAQEEMDRFEGYWWSPDGETLAYEEARLGGVETLTLGDPTHPEKGAELKRYPRPGMRNADVRLGLIPASGGHSTWVDWDHAKYPYLCAATWTKRAPLTIVVSNREQTEEAVLAVDRNTGGTSTLWVEKDRAWLNLQRRMPLWLEDGSGFLWISERSGNKVLELHAPDGKFVRALHAPDLNLRELLAVDAEAGTVWVSGGADPTQTQLFWLPLSGNGEPIRATTQAGVHGAAFGQGHAIYVHTFEGIDGEQRTTVHRRGGELLGEIRSVAEKPRLDVKLEVTTVNADSMRLWAAIVRPSHFRPGRKYPVLVNVYGGPHSQMVTSAPSRYLLAQWFADRGYIVVSIDGRGTPSRGRAWERAIKDDLIDVALNDQVAGLKALGARFPEMDLARVGIYGWSFGGYFSAMAVMRRPDVFHAGMAGAPVADWHDYDTFYTERYLGLPQANPRAYEVSSVLTYAKDLQRPLMIVHGTTDDNVYFMHSLKMADALFRAGKHYEFMPLPGFTHMVADPVVTTRLYSSVADFFSREIGAGSNGAAQATVPVP